MKNLRNQKGQGLVEYMIIVALMAVATMGIMRILSQTTSAKIANITQSLQGGKASINVEFDRVEKSHIQKKDMSNFIRGSRRNREK